MERKFLVVLLISLLLLASCSTQTLNYSGETENWSADLKVNQTSDDYQSQELVLKYKGDDVNEVGPIDYNVDSLGSFGRGGVTLKENGTIVDSATSNPTNAKVSEHTEVEVTVEWNEKTETFKLSKQ
ncbi:hypothetical protein [Halobacillus sp. Nhm2S1]|uniref:hypothetical protein n=1 Tax=Halobacillus sp. Nhm2S1 TaxID=2866716 RepID=UPI001C73A3B1|nr:hypothetical protein [Halobacillus sp. Nhm2S1]MBX0356861.1 hypothetical protein [Halobacillus sp. Nhm2S1]